MSSSQPVLHPAEYVQYNTISLSIQLSVHLATSVWVIYEHSITLTDEIQHFWGRRPTAVMVIFMVLRYGMLLQSIISLNFSFIQWNATSVTGIAGAIIIINAIVYMTVILFSVVRMRAISMKRSGLKASIVFVLGTIYVCINAWHWSLQSIRPLTPLFGGQCSSYTLKERAAPTDVFSLVQEEAYSTRRVEIINHAGDACLVLSELLVQFYTWESILRSRLLLDRQRVKPFYRVLLRDGTVIYLAMIIWWIVTAVSGETGIGLSDMTLPGISITICRIIIRLRRTQESDSIVRRPDTTYARRSQVPVGSAAQNLTTIPAGLSGGVRRDDGLTYFSDSSRIVDYSNYDSRV
ncbi:hypothetical protein NM688_g9227 [Phlebia brevispora]|uniref:Uncharacterized protein n=1 Tax=Phlebia brevispora TaxID=194682 RepID=A0ACC1RLH3_9APHY|nr:hypothetical protein NM688_g9227 [Phlebia brevispora]